MKKQIKEILQKCQENKYPSKQEAKELLKIEEGTKEWYSLLNVANKLSRDKFKGQGEVFGQIGINLKPCPKNCAFCRFSEKWTSFQEEKTLSTKEVIERAKDYEEAGANAVFLMATADHSFDKFIKIGSEVREQISSDLPLVANIDDFGHEGADELLRTGFQGVYHVSRLREGEDTEISPQKREKTLKAIRDSELDLSYCVEPIGPEHTIEEIVEEIFRGKRYEATNHAVMWRVPPEGGPKSELNQISQMGLAKYAATTILVANNEIKAMGVHEATTLPLIAGSNQIYAETGTNPRDNQEDTLRGRGLTVKDCRNILREAELTPRKKPTNVFTGKTT